MIKKYVKGSKTNPEGVIKALENLGGVNTCHYEGDSPTSVYYIDNSGSIFRAAIESALAEVILECFEEIQPVQPVQPIESAPKVITNLDVAKWYFHMLREGHAVQLMYANDYIVTSPWDYFRDDDKTNVLKVRIDFGEWMTIEEAEVGIWY